MADDPVDITSLNASDAAARLVEISRAYIASQPAPALHELSPEVAGQRLAEMEKAFREANKPKNTAADAALVGEQPPQEIETVSWPAVSTRNKLDAIETLRNVGIPDAGITRILRGDEGGFSEQDVAMAEQWRRRAEQDPELRARILSGDPAARHVLTGMSAILAYGAKGA